MGAKFRTAARFESRVRAHFEAALISGEGRKKVAVWPPRKKLKATRGRAGARALFGNEKIKRVNIFTEIESQPSLIEFTFGFSPRTSPSASANHSPSCATALHFS